ncbi:ribosomal protein S12 methylthiotransferase RimO [Planctomycetales bacterium]|nr:ribosomal protein S12 methylthiotransferase RimO [Planctomycetales bacterium]
MSPKSSRSSPPAALLVSLGCPKNQVDAEAALSELVADGFALTATADFADLILINTCGFIQAARDETEAEIANALAVKKARPRCRVAIMGCYAQRYRAEILTKFPALDGILGLDAAGNLAARCRQILAGAPQICGFAPPSAAREAPRLITGGGSYAYLRVGDGCDNRCAYCAIPSIRGGRRSRAPQAIIDEAKHIVENGFRELILVAQDTTIYGADLRPASSLTALVERILQATAAPRVRILYAHPAHLTDDLLRLLGAEPRLCGYLDLPLQHVGDRLLTAMNRHYGRRRVDEIFERVARYCPNLTLRSTFIVGFPGETDAEFAELLAFTQADRIAHLGAFVYSPEAGTPAAQLPAPVAPRVAAERLAQIMLAQQKNAFRRLDRRVGATETVLVDALDGKEILARSVAEAPEIDHVIKIKTPRRPARKIQAGDFLTVKINRRQDYDLLGEMA